MRLSSSSSYLSRTAVPPSRSSSLKLPALILKPRRCCLAYRSTSHHHRGHRSRSPIIGSIAIGSTNRINHRSLHTAANLDDTRYQRRSEVIAGRRRFVRKDTFAFLSFSSYATIVTTTNTKATISSIENLNETMTNLVDICSPQLTPDNNREGLRHPSIVNDKNYVQPTITTIEEKNAAKIVTDIRSCAIRIREEGKLVAFPTETVYGLGANAYNVQAIHTIFQAKERPLTDPLIVHVLHPSDAYPLWYATSSSLFLEASGNDSIISEKKILQILCDSFWPGPLTIVAKATPDVIPDMVMANTGYCACRSPSHPIARQLLQQAAVPIVAPSANKFGHVSPTSYQHVYHDLCHEDVWILSIDDEGGKEQHNNDNMTSSNAPQAITSCEVGVESTVAKVERLDGIIYITILRQGAISENDIRSCLQSAGLMTTTITKNRKELLDHNNNTDHVPIVIRSNWKRATKDTVANIAPGQLIKHYSPNIPSFLLSRQCINDHQNLVNGEDDDHDKTMKIQELLRYAVIIDYGQRLLSLKDMVLQYRDISIDEDSTVGAKVLFDTLRWAEQIPDAKVILFPQITIVDDREEETASTTSSSYDALTIAIQDKLNRAASGIIIDSFMDVSDKI